MTDTLNAVFNKLGTADIGFGDSTSTFTQEDRLQTDGSTADQSAQYVDTAVIPLSSAAKTSLGLTGTKYIDNGITTLLAGTSMQYASDSQNGQVYRTSVAPSVSNQPTAFITDDPKYSRIPTAAVYNALTGSTQTPDYGNTFVTRYELQLSNAYSLGSGKDGHGKLGAVSASSTAPTITSTATSGLLTNGTGYDYKIAAYNLAGEIVASSASSSTGAVTAKQITLTLPALPSNAMGWNVYRRTAGSGNYEYVGRAVLGFNYTETASDAKRYLYYDNNPTPNASVTAPGSDTTGTSATISGLFQFITFTTTASDTITVAATGVYAGLLDIRVQGTWTGASLAWTITGTGKNAINVGNLRRYGYNYGNPGMFTALANSGAATTFTAATVTGATANMGAQGYGADCSQVGKNYAGFGTKGSGTTGGDGGYGGALVRIWCSWTDTGTVGGTINCLGAAGSAGATNGGGGGGGAGGLIDLGCFFGWSDVGTRNVSGGAGGNGAGTGRGGAGGGGGAVVRRNCHSTSGATTTVAGGATGTNGGTTADGGYGGAHYGNGGWNVSGGNTVAAAGQTFAFNGFYDPMPAFAA